MPTTAGIAIEPVGAGWRLSCAQRVPRPPAEIFPFFATARNLERITPAFLHFRILRSTPEPLAAGARIDYALRLHGLPVRWRTRIDAWEPPRRFVDRQVRGPFRTWVHTHTFQALGDGTLIGDVVLFDLYCRPLARTPALGWIFADLRAIFEHRRREVERVFRPKKQGPA